MTKGKLERSSFSTVRRWFFYFAAGCIGGAVVWIGQGHSLRLLPDSMSYPDLVASLLAAVAVMVAIFGVVMAVLAIFGYRHFKSVVEKASKASAEEVINNSAEAMVVNKVNSKEIRELILTEVGNIITNGGLGGTLSPWLDEQKRREDALREIDKDFGEGHE